MLNNTADKIMHLALTQEMEKYILYDHKRNLKFGNLFLLLCPSWTVFLLNISDVTNDPMAV